MRGIHGFLLAAVLVLPALPGSAQVGEEGFFDARADEAAEQMDRKRPSLWRRPRKDTPAEQLAYAAEVLERGHRRAAAGQYRALVHQWHDRPEAVTAQFRYARLLEEAGELRKAFDEYQYLVQFFPGRFPYDEILERQFAIANHMMRTRQLGLFFFGGFHTPERALTMFRRIVANAPSWEHAAEAQYRIGWIHEEKKQYEDAVRAYGVVLHRYPKSAFVDLAGFRQVLCLQELAQRSPRDELACRRALSACSSYLARYAQDREHTQRAREVLAELKQRLGGMYYATALFYDRMGRAQAAVIAYKDFTLKFPNDDRIRRALRRIDALSAVAEKESTQRAASAEDAEAPYNDIEEEPIDADQT